jgi:hypothetical protein
VADPTAIKVPFEDPDQTAFIDVGTVPNPFPGLNIWFTSRTVTGVPENVMGWMVAQGWRITGVSNDNTTVPPTATYTLQKDQLSPEQTLLYLCNSYTDAANDARFANEVRYADIVNDWTEMLGSTDTHFQNQITAQNADLGVYLTDLDSYMDDIDTLIDGNANGLEGDYASHKTTAEAFLTDLGTTELARINELFAATLATQLQSLIDRGLYSSAVAADIIERNTRDRDEQIQQLNDRLNREKLGNEHQLWAQRVQLSDQQNQVIAQRLNTATARLDGWKNVAAENQRLMAYQLDTRNNLLVGLYSFVERREDVAPAWKDMASMVVGIGDSGTAWITP